MILNSINKVRNGKYLKNYELNYTNKSGKSKIFEIVSYNDINSIADLGNHVDGVVIVALVDKKLLLLHEFRMGVNKRIYNLCAGRIEKNESIEECVKRELFEESGLELLSICEILKPAYASVGLSDTANQLVIVKAKGNIEDHTSENEDIIANLYTKEQVENLLSEFTFASRAQSIAYSFVNGVFDKFM